MRFEKWQALGNDYLIVEADGLDPERVRALCDRHRGVGADGVLALAPPDQPGYVARLRIFNPDGSEAELSGNGARQALLYLRANGWTDARTYSIQTLAGEIRATNPRSVGSQSSRMPSAPTPVCGSQMRRMRGGVSSNVSAPSSKMR